MGKKSDPPPAPDYGPLIAQSTEAARLNYQLGRDQLAWAKEQYARDSELTSRVVDRMVEAQDFALDAARADRTRYETEFQPLESDLIRDAQTYASPERRALEVGRATSQVAQQFDAARRAAQRNLESYGIDPTATRFAALDIGARTQQAAAAAAAANQASQNVDNTARALRSEAINIGKGYPAQITSSAALSNQSGAGAVNSNLATTASGANTMGTAPQWMGLGNQALGTAGGLMNTQYQNQLAAWKADQSSSSGIGKLLGAGLGLFLDEGGEVPPEASPTGGRAIDDVPANLTAGEFVVPKEAVDWYGQKHFYSLIEKARQERANAQHQTGALPSPGNDNAAPMPRQALPAR